MVCARHVGRSVASFLDFLDPFLLPLVVEVWDPRGSMGQSASSTVYGSPLNSACRISFPYSFARFIWAEYSVFALLVMLGPFPVGRMLPSRNPCRSFSSLMFSPTSCLAASTRVRLHAPDFAQVEWPVSARFMWGVLEVPLNALNMWDFRASHHFTQSLKHPLSSGFSLMKWFISVRLFSKTLGVFACNNEYARDSNFSLLRSFESFPDFRPTDCLKWNSQDTALDTASFPYTILSEFQLPPASSMTKPVGLKR